MKHTPSWDSDTRKTRTAQATGVLFMEVEVDNFDRAIKHVAFLVFLWTLAWVVFLVVQRVG
jgi:hypothetical protein